MRKPQFTRLKFNLEKLKDTKVAANFKATVGGKFAPLLIFHNDEEEAEDEDIDGTVNAFNTAIIETATKVLGKLKPKKRPWITHEILEMCDKRRELKKSKGDPEGAQEYRKINKKIKKEMKKAKQDWIDEQCRDIEESLNRNKQ